MIDAASPFTEHWRMWHRFRRLWKTEPPRQEADPAESPVARSSSCDGRNEAADARDLEPTTAEPPSRRREHGGSPYSGLLARAFWRTGVSERPPLQFEDLFKSKFPIGRRHAIATAGSCFAQHIGRRFAAAGYKVIDAEPAPRGFTEEDARLYGYGLYSARYGNIYTARQLSQLAREAFGEFTPAESVWRKDDRYYDAFRPSVEPNGLSSPEEVAAHRRSHLAYVREVIEKADLFIFTFGLTEAWEHTASKTVYPTAPGTIAGDFDPDVFSFRNFTHAETLADFLAFYELAKARNAKIRFLLTVSPVPLTATASDEHVLAATLYSKSTLRSVAGELYHRLDDVEYFPSYEIIAAHPSKASFYEEDLRSVSAAGVETVMGTFFAAQGADPAAGEPTRKGRRDGAAKTRSKQDLVCEDLLLEAFAK